MTELQFLCMILGLLAVAVTLVLPKPNIWQLLGQRIALGVGELYYSDFTLQGLERALDGDYSATDAHHAVDLEERKCALMKEYFDKLHVHMNNKPFTKGMDDLIGRHKLKKMRQLVRQFSELEVPVSFEVKIQLTAFKTLYEQYTDLLKRLIVVQKALEDDKYELIEDELVVYSDMEYPIILVKQYIINGVWHALPASGFITDMETIRNWVSVHATHPKTRDSLFSPKWHTIKGDSGRALQTVPTRYVWHELTRARCITLELLEGAVALRAQYNKLFCILSELKVQRLTASSSCPQSLFAFVNKDHKHQSDCPVIEPSIVTNVLLN